MDCLFSCIPAPIRVATNTGVNLGNSESLTWSHLLLTTLPNAVVIKIVCHREDGCTDSSNYGRHSMEIVDSTSVVNSNFVEKGLEIFRCV